MGSAVHKKRFRGQELYEVSIETDSGELVGTLRVRPVSVWWTPKSGKRWYAVSIEKFSEWMVENGTPRKG